MQETTLGELRVRITGGTDREGGGDGPVVVLMHGFGASGVDLVPLWRVLDVPHPVRFVFPEGPLSLAAYGYGDARAWWMLDVERLSRASSADRSAERPEGLPPVRAQLMGMLDGMQTALSVEPSQVVLGGFSQGSMLALDAVLQGYRPAGLALLSSTLINREEWVPRMPDMAAVPVLQTHGRSDEVLPLDGAVALRDALSRAGATVQWVEFGGGHELPPTALDALAQFVQERLPC